MSKKTLSIPDAFVKMRIKRNEENKRLMEEMRLRGLHSTRAKEAYQNSEGLRRPLDAALFTTKGGVLTGTALSIIKSLLNSKLAKDMHDEEDENSQRFSKYYQDKEAENASEREKLKDLEERLMNQYDQDRERTIKFEDEDREIAARKMHNEEENRTRHNRIEDEDRALKRNLTQAQIEKLMEESRSIRHDRNNPVSKPNSEAASDARYERGRLKEVHLKQLDAVKNMIPKEQYVELLDKAGTPDFEIPSDIEYRQPSLLKVTLDKLFGKTERKPKPKNRSTQAPQEDYYINHDTGEKISVAEFKRRQANGTL
jgi:hypothetical protein